MKYKCLWYLFKIIFNIFSNEEKVNCKYTETFYLTLVRITKINKQMTIDAVGKMEHLLIANAGAIMYSHGFTKGLKSWGLVLLPRLPVNHQVPAIALPHSSHSWNYRHVSKCFLKNKINNSSMILMHPLKTF